MGEGAAEAAEEVQEDSAEVSFRSNLLLDLLDAFRVTDHVRGA